MGVKFRLSFELGVTGGLRRLRPARKQLLRQLVVSGEQTAAQVAAAFVDASHVGPRAGVLVVALHGRQKAVPVGPPDHKEPLLHHLQAKVPAVDAHGRHRLPPPGGRIVGLHAAQVGHPVRTAADLQTGSGVFVKGYALS